MPADQELGQLRQKLEGYQALLAETSDAAEIGALCELIKETEQRLRVLKERSKGNTVAKWP